MSADFQPYLVAVEQELRRIVSAPGQDVAPLYKMMAYHLGWLDLSFRPTKANSGKRLRPLLCLLSCQAAGGDWHRALPTAAALELVHNFSLIHDDIEDNSPTRRGRPTVWSSWGLAHGINVGDSMLVLARLALAGLSSLRVEAATLLEAVAILDKACWKLCQGQYLDIAGEGKLDISKDSYLQMIGAKTAALIAASAQLGALMADAGDRMEHYRQFGWQLGLAFQMVDDILGIWGDPATTGKPAASDIASRKMTMPVIFALAASSESQELANLYGKNHLSGADVPRVIAILDHAGARQHVQRMAARYEASALAALDAAGADGAAAGHLRDLAASLTLRQQ